MPRKGVDASGMVEGREHILTGLHFDERQLGELRVSENSNEQYGLGLDFVNRFNRFAIMPGRMMLCYDADSLARKVPPILRNIGVRFDGWSGQRRHSGADQRGGLSSPRDRQGA